MINGIKGSWKIKQHKYDALAIINNFPLVSFPPQPYISVILSASFKEQRLPSIWKLADVTPLPKQKPVKEIKKDLRPILLTPCISKFAEDCVVTEYVKPAVLCMLDPRQFGAIPKSSTTLALLEMIHEWTQGTDGKGSTIRTLLFDYKKAFDLIDHSILVRKLCALSIPPSITNCAARRESNSPKAVYQSGAQFLPACLKGPN